jgi:hypothetical protein
MRRPQTGMRTLKRDRETKAPTLTTSQLSTRAELNKFKNSSSVTQPTDGVASDSRHHSDILNGNDRFGFIYIKSTPKIGEAGVEERDGLHWARDNTADQKEGATEKAEKQKSVKNKLKSYDIVKKFGINEKAMAMLEKVQDYDFDIFELNKETKGDEMIVCSTYLFYKHNLFVNLTIDPDTFDKFIRHIQAGYYDVAYHNKLHGMDVGRLAYYYATRCELMEKAKLTELDLAALIVGGVIHDYEHIGWNNAFLIETQHEWAIRYNDISVLENHHVAAAFKVILSQVG